MNLANAMVVLRPRTLSEVLDLTCRFCLSIALRLYLKLFACVLLPCFAGCLLLRYMLEWSWLSVWMVAIAWGTVIQGVFTAAAGRLLFAESAGVRQVLGGFRSRLFPYLGSLLMSRLFMAAAFLVAFVPVFFAWTRMLFLYEASLLEGAKAYDALLRSTRFVRGRGMEAFLVLLSLLLAQGAAIVATEFLGDALLDDVLLLGKPLGALFTDGGSPMALLGFLLSIPYVATARFLSYIDSRTRNDGWDIQVRFMAIAAKEASEQRAAA
jgi:hypothetical protein